MRAVVIGLGERGIGLRGLDLGGLLRRLLRLDRAVDDRQHLARADPAAGIDEHADDAAARAGNADRLVALGGERAAGGDHAADLLRPGTTTVTVGTWPAPRGALRRLVGRSRAISDESDQITISGEADAAAMTSRRRRRERSTTTSVSEEWIEVSLFMMSMPACREFRVLTRRAVLAE